MTRVAVVGTGLIGGSIGLALARLGYDVVGFDRDADRLARAPRARRGRDRSRRSLDGAVDGRRPRGRRGAGRRDRRRRGRGARRGRADRHRRRLGEGAGRRRGRRGACPTGAPRFVGGHPMAGSEQDGVDGADADLFVGATWVLTPTADTDADAYTTVRAARAAARRRGRRGRRPNDHDVLVAFVSHVPQLAASTLMDVATDARRRAPRAAAARGRRLPRHDAHRRRPSRDLARHPHGQPRRGARRARRVPRGAAARCATLVAAGDRDGLLDMLERARVGAAQPARRARRWSTELVELRIPVPDRPGVLAEVTTLARPARRQHRRHRDRALASRAAPVCSCSSSPAAGADAFEAGLHELGYHVARRHSSERR